MRMIPRVIVLFMYIFFSMENGISITSSTSKIKNKIRIMKYWVENGSFDGESSQIPHSNESVFWGDVFFFFLTVFVSVSIILEMMKIVDVINHAFLEMLFRKLSNWKLDVTCHC